MGERPAIVLVDEILDRDRVGVELRRIHAEYPEHLTRADDVVACPFPFPASDAGDALRAGELPRQVAADGVFMLGLLVRGFEPLLPARDATVHVVEPALQPLQARRPGFAKGR